MSVPDAWLVSREAFSPDSVCYLDFCTRNAIGVWCAFSCDICAKRSPNQWLIDSMFEFETQVQFILIFVHSFQLLFRECNYPRGFMWWIGFHAVLFWFLFWDFYKNAYRPPRGSQRTGLRGLASMCSLDYQQVSNGHQKNGTIVKNGNNRINYSNGIHETHKNGIKSKELWSPDKPLLNVILSDSKFNFLLIFPKISAFFT